ncbi:conserved Plasmodium protein, unknown function [Plasmodium vinckei vinckei]|uniref:General transcription factor 3C polypeptide 3 n=1 Tax=Plasmodium vinckei vinckei TaxID=54757 RepID=A0A081I9H7_PLAVN|nr:conserved Plasmodium protein, unknown function [Plasmodium vinckei vinckei]KEG00335.1 hypothetical protein YYE_04846 [Plasmodium vinckei vinckei]VEV54487.1 conserved Plasmodium protein, unknown function [Plasmodium vinckei vinckei]
MDNHNGQHKRWQYEVGSNNGKENIDVDSESDDSLLENLLNLNESENIDDSFYSSIPKNNKLKNGKKNKQFENDEGEESDLHHDYNYEETSESEEEEKSEEEKSEEDKNKSEEKSNYSDLVSDDDVLKYYNMVKSSKSNDESLQNKINKLLNLKKKVETYEEKQKKILLNSVNDDDIDILLYDNKEDEMYFFHFLDELNKFKKKTLAEYENEKVERQDEIFDSINNRNIIIGEERLLDINNINLNNILYFYFYSNQSYILNLGNTNKNVYTYDSYIFENYDELDDESGNLKLDSSSNTSISDEDLLLLKHNNDESDNMFDDENGYLEKQRNKKKKGRKKKRGNKKGKTEKMVGSNEPSKMNKEVESLINKANNNYINQNYKECIKLLEQVIKISPDLHDPYHLLGLIYEREYDNLKKAINYYLIAAHLTRNDFLTWYNISNLCKIEKEYNILLYCLYKAMRLYKRKKARLQKKKNNNKEINLTDENSPNEYSLYMHEIENEKSPNSNEGEQSETQIDFKKTDEGNCDHYDKKEVFDDFMNHLHFNIAFTYILIEDYKNCLKNLLIIKENNNRGSYNIIVDIYICICLVIINRPEECYSFLKDMYIKVTKKASHYSLTYYEKNIICLFMQSQILNNKYNECIFVYKKLTRNNEHVHVDIFSQFIKSIISVVNLKSRYLINTNFFEMLKKNYILYEDIIFSVAESYYGKGMYTCAIYFYQLIYKQKRQGKCNDTIGSSDSESGNFLNNITTEKARSMNEIISFDNKINLTNFVYKMVKSYYYIGDYVKGEKIILKILSNENIEKDNIEIDIKTLYIDILYKLKKYNKSINILLSIKEKKLRSTFSIPKPLSNKEREILLLKIFRKKNKLLLYTSHNKYILHIFYIYPQKKQNSDKTFTHNNIHYMYDNYVSHKNINNIIKINSNICFCYFCIKYNLPILNSFYLYNILHTMNCKNMEVKKMCQDYVGELHKYREYLLYLSSSFNIFKNESKKENYTTIVYKNLKIEENKLYYKDVMIVDIVEIIEGNYDKKKELSKTVCNINNVDSNTREEFYSNLYKYKYNIESEILNNRVVMKFYKFSYTLFYFLYELEHDFSRIYACMEKETFHFRKLKKDNQKMMGKNDKNIISTSHPGGNYDGVLMKLKNNSMTSDNCESGTNRISQMDEINFNHNQYEIKERKKKKGVSFLHTKKKMNFFSFESYLGLYFSILFLEECFFLVSIMNLYDDSIHMLSLYLKNRKSSKIKLLTYINFIKTEFKKRHDTNIFSNIHYYFFDNIYTNSIKENINKHYNKIIKNGNNNNIKNRDCRYYIFRINLLLNKLYISSGNYEKQVRYLNDLYIFNKKKKNEYRILKYYTDIVLTGRFSQNFLVSVSRSKYKNILIIFRLFLVRSIHFDKTNPFLIYLIANVCNISSMVIHAIHEFTRAYTFLLNSRRENSRILNKGNADKAQVKNKMEQINIKNLNEGAIECCDSTPGQSENSEGEINEQNEREMEKEGHGYIEKKLENKFEGISDDVNFLFSLMASYFNYSGAYKVENRESVIMTSFCILNEYILKRYDQKIKKKKKKYIKYSQFYKIYKYIYLAEILYNLGRALHYLSYFNECIKLYLNVITLIKKADKEIKKLLKFNERFIYDYVINMKKCMCYTCLNYSSTYQKTDLIKIVNYYKNLNTKYSNFYLLFFDKKHLLFSASYNLSVIFRKLGRFEQAKYFLRHIVWD